MCGHGFIFPFLDTRRTHMQTLMLLCAELVLRLLVEEEEGLTQTKAAMA